MKAILCLPLFLASFACADEVSDRAAITRTIVALNELPPRTSEIAESPTAASELSGLLIATAEVRPAASPTVTISHEPWGEATINFPGIEVLRYRVATATMRFLTPDVALVDGYWTRTDGPFLFKPVLFVMKKVGDAWKIASARMLASR